MSKKRYYKNDEQKEDTREYNSKSKSGSNNRRRDRDNECKDRNVRKIATANDPSWYSRSAAQLAATATFSFNNPMGSGFDLSFNAPTADQAVKNYNVPGVLSIKVAPIFGVGDSANDPINVAATDNYGYIRYTNSGSKNYEPADLMIYFMTMDSAYMFLAWMRRIYGLMRVYTGFNYYWPRYVVEADGVDFKSIHDNMAQFRAYIEQFGAQLSSFWTPANMPIYIRHWELFSNVYSDAPSFKSQLYIYSPVGFYKFEPYESETGGKLAFTPLPSSTGQVTMTFDQIVAYGENILSGILNIDDQGIMSGDVLKAYGSGGINKVPAMDVNYTVMPIYSAEILYQIHNATIFAGNLSGAGAPNAQLDVEQENGLIKFNPKLTAISDLTSAWSGTRLMNFKYDDPTPADVMVASRLISIGELDSTKRIYSIESAGAEIVLGAYIYTVNSNGTLGREQIHTFPTSSEDVLPYLALTNFDLGPLCYYITPDSSDPTWYSKVDPIGDIQNYRMFSKQELTNMNRTAILSLLGCPVLGSKS